MCIRDSLTRLFQEAIRTGKQVRTSTGVARNRLSTAHAGLDLAERALGGSGALHGRRVALLGAGEIAGIAARILRNRAADTVIINRSSERGSRLAADVAASACGLDALDAELAQATGKEPQWNFHKYLIDRSGKVVANFPGEVAPDSPALVAVIEKSLHAK